MRYFEVELYGVSKGDAVIGTLGCRAAIASAAHASNLAMENEPFVTFYIVDRQLHSGQEGAKELGVFIRSYWSFPTID